jgi:putative peptide zinc metalloprotease protein
VSSPARGGLLSAARPGDAAAALAARHGKASERPKLRPDLVIRRQVRMGDVTWVVKNPENQSYFNFTDGEWGVISLFDGTRTPAEIAEQYTADTGADGVDLSFVLEYDEMLRKLGLLDQSAAERNLALLQNMKTARKRAAEAKAEGFNPFFIQFRVVDPDRFLNKTVRYVRWIWTPPVFAVWACGAIWTVSIFTQHFGPIFRGTYELYAFLGKPLLDIIQFFLILSIIGGIHELGHAYGTKIYGGEVHDIGIALLYFTPAFYCDTTDAILFSNKWHRLWVCVAGIYIEGFICTGATALWVASYPDTLLHEVAFKTMLFTGVSTIFFNINPLIKIDGYYALTSVLELPELREDSFRYLGAWVQNRVLRLPVEVPVLSRRKRRVYWIYGVLALAYTAVIMRFIGGIFFHFYNRYFPNFAIVLLLLTLYRVFRKRVRLVTRTARLVYLDKRDLLMAPRTRPALIAAGAVLLAVLLIPWMHRTVAAPIQLDATRRVSVEAPEDAIVMEVLAREGQAVRAGQPLFRLASPSAEADQAAQGALRARFEGQAREARQASSAADTLKAERLGRSAQSALDAADVRRERLTLRSPIEGRVLTPRLEDLLGRSVPKGTSLAEVGDTRVLRADIAVSERRLDDLVPGELVTAQLPGRPFRTARGKVRMVSAATAAQPKTAAAEAEPEPPGTFPDKFIAVAEFDNADGSLVPGMSGRAKIYSKRTSPLASAARVLRRWLQTVFW